MTVNTDSEKRHGEGVPMPISSVTQSRYGAPAEVLSIKSIDPSCLKPGPNDVLIQVTKRPIHPGDVHIVRGLPKGGPQIPIDAGKSCPTCGQEAFRIPGYEGVGVIVAVGSAITTGRAYSIGQRVSFFHPAAGSWSTHVRVPATAAVVLPDGISDDVAALMLINTITARVVLRAGHNALPPDYELPVSILQTAAASSVGLLISKLAMDLGVKPIRLVRTAERASSLRSLLPGSPVIATEDTDWMSQVKLAFADRPRQVAIDSVGGSFLNDIASLIEDGGAVVNFGWLGGGDPDLSSFAPRQLSFRGVGIGGWFRTTSEELRRTDISAALKLAQTNPELFQVKAEFPLSEIQAAIEESTRLGTPGTVILSS